MASHWLWEQVQRVRVSVVERVDLLAVAAQRQIANAIQHAIAEEAQLILKRGDRAVHTTVVGILRERYCKLGACLEEVASHDPQLGTMEQMRRALRMHELLFLDIEREMARRSLHIWYGVQRQLFRPGALLPSSRAISRADP